MDVYHSAVIIADISGVVLFPQEEWENFSGQTSQQATGMGWTHAFLEADREELRRALIQVRERQKVQFEARVWNASSGTHRLAIVRLIQVTPYSERILEGDSPKASHLLVIITDVQQVRQIEHDLRSSQQRVEVMFSQAIIGIFQVNPEGAFVAANQRFCEIVGRSHEELLSLKLGDITHPDDQLRSQSLFKVSLQNRKGFEVQKRYLRPGGEVVWTRNYVSVVWDENGPPQFSSIMVQDITSQRAAEGQRIHLMMRERAAREEAERASRAKDEFMAMLSHELRTPLTPVLMTASVLENDEAIPQSIRNELGMIRRNIELEARLIDDLLDLTRITHGKLKLETGAVDMHLLIRQTMDFLNPSDSCIEIDFELNASAHYVEGDAARLRQVVWNLFKNAFKFTPPGGKIGVSTRNEKRDLFVLEVKDTGTGIEFQNLEKIFSAFDQGNAERRFGGLGLGLTISKAIVNLHGGEIFACSEGIGRGSTFTVHLKSSDSHPAGRDLLHGRAPSTAPASGLRVLVVEDHQATLEVLVKLLCRRGHQVTGVSTVAKALAASEGRGFDLIVSDLGLPDGSGLELMKALSVRQKIPGIALSGFGMEEDMRRAREAGFSKHLVKPINFDELCKAIEEVTSGCVASKSEEGGKAPGAEEGHLP